MTSANVGEKQNYLAFKAQIFTDFGRVVVCAICDPIIDNQCILTEKEKLLQSTLCSKPETECPALACRLKLGQSILEKKDCLFLRPLHILRKPTTIADGTTELAPVRKKKKKSKPAGNLQGIMKQKNKSGLVTIHGKEPVGLQLAEETNMVNLTDMDTYEKPVLPLSRNIIKVNITNHNRTIASSQGDIKDKIEDIMENAVNLKKHSVSTKEMVPVEESGSDELTDTTFKEAVDTVRSTLVKLSTMRMSENSTLPQTQMSNDPQKPLKYMKRQSSETQEKSTDQQGVQDHPHLQNRDRLEHIKITNAPTSGGKNISVKIPTVSLKLQKGNLCEQILDHPKTRVTEVRGKKKTMINGDSVLRQFISVPMHADTTFKPCAADLSEEMTSLHNNWNKTSVEYTQKGSKEPGVPILRELRSIPVHNENSGCQEIWPFQDNNSPSMHSVAHTFYAQQLKGGPPTFPNEFPDEKRLPQAVYQDNGLSESVEKPLSAIPDLILSGQPADKRIQNLPNISNATPKNDEMQPENVSHIPVTQRLELVNSDDSTVRAMVKRWPWSKPIQEVNKVSYRSAKLEDEYKYMMRCYEDDSAWIQIVVTGYPHTWNRQQVLDALINWKMLQDMPLVPCFIEFSPKECKFLVNKNSIALDYLHSNNLSCRKDDYRLDLTVSQVNLSLNDVKFSLQKFLDHRLKTCYDVEANVVNLKAFLLKSDISQMCYFPLNKVKNQKTITGMSSNVAWENITKLILSSNRLMFINHFHFADYMISLKDLDVSDNLLSSASKLTCCRGILLTSLRLEGNPLCWNFIDQDDYVDAVKWIFPTIVYLDGVKIWGLPEPKKNFCLSAEAKPLVELFLETFFTLLESKQRHYMHEMYAIGAILTVSSQVKIKKDHRYAHIEPLKNCRDVRLLNEIMEHSIVGRNEITDYIYSWPPIIHDPYTFTVDVLYYSETTTILTVTGSMRIFNNASENEMLDFTRTFVFSTRDGVKYLIENDMWYISEPTAERLATAFKEPRPKPKPVSLMFENAPDDDLKNELANIFSKLTELKRSQSLRYLETRNWHMRAALEYFIYLEESGNIDKLCEDDAG